MTLQSISAAIEFILDQDMDELVACYALPPDNLDAVPASYVLTGGAGASDSGNDLRLMTRTYRVQFAIMPKGAATPSVRESRIRPLLEKAYTVLAAYPTLRHPMMLASMKPLGIQSAVVRGDSGIVVLPEWGARYVGFEIRLEVVEIVRHILRD